LVRQVLALDAFARCWVQEIVLLRALAPVVATDDKRDAYQRLVGAWQARRDRQFDQAMTALAAPIAAAACDVERLANPRLRDTLRDALRSLVAGQQENDDQQRAARALASRLDAGLRESTERLITIHGLSGHAADEVRERLDRARANAGTDAPGQGRGTRRCAVGRPVGPRRRPRGRRSELRRRHAARGDRRRRRRRRAGTRGQRPARPQRRASALGRRVARWP
jgi:hypothetical protein